MAWPASAPATSSVDKLTSDSVAVTMGRYASQNLGSLRVGHLSWDSLLGVLASGLRLFIDWRALLLLHKFVLDFKIFA